MHLVENVHFETLTAEPRHYIYNGSGEILAYFAYIADEKPIMLRRTHPDVGWDDIAQHGEHLWNMQRVRDAKVANRSACQKKT